MILRFPTIIYVNTQADELVKSTDFTRLLQIEPDEDGI